MRTTVSFDKVTKIIHISDIHIRLFKRYDEYLECFQELERQIRGYPEGTIVIVTGDVVHTKTEMSPESLLLTSAFFTKLADLYPTFVIAGNHDTNLNNKSRLDALSPIIENLNHPNLHYWRTSGVYQVADCDFAVHSIIDGKEHWPTVDQCTSPLKFALYHGPVYSAQTDVGFMVTNRHVELDQFDGYTATLLGDIHRFQTLGDETHNAIVYAGSLIQQNHGESLKGHGWVEWNILEDGALTYKFRELNNNYGYYTIRVDGDCVPDYSDMPKHVRLRIFAGSMTDAQIKKLVSTIRSTHKIEELSVSNFAMPVKNANTDIQVLLDNITNVDYQTTLLKEYLLKVAPELAADQIEEIIQLNRDTNLRLKGTATSNIRWTPISLKFDNLFTFGEGNVINFSSLNGVVGLFAPNASGKSSVPDAICFALYDRTPRTHKASNIMNTRKDSCYLEFEFEIEGVHYVVERKGTRNKKGEVKIDANFYRKNADGTTTSLNGEERRVTYQIIRTYVGEYDDFLLTAFSTQGQNALFVDRGQSDRKDLLSQFLGLGIFDNLHSIANEDYKTIQVQLKSVDTQKFADELNIVTDEIKQHTILQAQYKNQLGDNKKMQDVWGARLAQAQSNKRHIPLVASLDVLTARLEKKADELREVRAKIVATQATKTRYTDLLEKAKVKMTSDYSTVLMEFEIAQREMELTKKLLDEKRIKEALLGRRESQLNDISSYSYDPECEFCLRNGKTTIEKKKSLEDDIAIERQTLADILSQLSPLENKDYSEIVEKHTKYHKGLEFIATTEQSLLQAEREQEKLKMMEDNLVNSVIPPMLQDIDTATQAKDDIEFNKTVDVEIAEINRALSELKTEANNYSQKERHHDIQLALLKKTQDTLFEKLKHSKEIEAKGLIYKYYLTAMSRDGIPYQQISSVLPVIQTHVNTILSQMADFSISLELDGKNVNGHIVYDQDRNWPLELASGMEKFISSLAIRVALMNICSLPQSNFLIIDEGFGVLDASNMASLASMLELLKTQFQWVLAISHIDTIRDMVETTININRDDGFSQVQVT